MKRLFLAAFLATSPAFAEAVDVVNSPVPQQFVKGAYFGPTAPNGMVSDSQPFVVNGNAVVTGVLTIDGGTTNTSGNISGNSLVGGLLDAGAIYTPATLGAGGDLRAAANAYVAGQLDAGAIFTPGPLGATGLTSFGNSANVAGTLDAGGLIVTGASATVNGFLIPQISHGSDAGTSGVLSVNFGTAFTGSVGGLTLPDCTCSNVNATAAACDVTSRSVSQAAFKSGAGSDVIQYICVH